MTIINRSRKAKPRVQMRLPISQDKSQTADAKVEAAAQATGVQRVLSGRHTTLPPATGEVTLAEALARYEMEITANKIGLEQERRRIVAWSGSDFAGIALSRLNRSHFAAYAHERISAGIARSTVRRELALISHVFTIARTAWELPNLANPIAGVRLPGRDIPRDRRLSSEEFARFQNALNSSDNRLIQINVRFALETAARKSELLNLTWADVDLSRRVILLRGTQKCGGRSVPLTQEAANLLGQVSDVRNRRVFPITPYAIAAVWRRILVRAEIDDFYYHDLRREAIYRLFERGLTVEEVQCITGYKTPALPWRSTQVNVSRILQHLDTTESPRSSLTRHDGLRGNE